MDLYAVLALGSTYAENKFSPFPKLCAERAKQAVSFVDDKFSIAVIQARLLLAACNHLIGKNTLGWDLSGSAREIIRSELILTSISSSRVSLKVSFVPYS